MGRKIKWEVGKFRSAKVKIYEETFNRYKLILKGRNRTVQQDLEDHIVKTISE